jgi:hypothetical protein
MMHTRAVRWMLPYRQPAPGAAARPASLELMVTARKELNIKEVRE